jgi:hypothetical protein
MDALPDVTVALERRDDEPNPGKAYVRAALVRFVREAPPGSEVIMDDVVVPRVDGGWRLPDGVITLAPVEVAQFLNKGLIFRSADMGEVEGVVTERVVVSPESGDLAIALRRGLVRAFGEGLDDTMTTDEMIGAINAAHDMLAWADRHKSGVDKDLARYITNAGNTWLSGDAQKLDFPVGDLAYQSVQRLQEAVNLLVEKYDLANHPEPVAGVGWSLPTGTGPVFAHAGGNRWRLLSNDEVVDEDTAILATCLIASKTLLPFNIHGVLWLPTIANYDGAPIFDAADSADAADGEMSRVTTQRHGGQAITAALVTLADIEKGKGELLGGGYVLASDQDVVGSGASVSFWRQRSPQRGVARQSTTRRRH